MKNSLKMISVLVLMLVGVLVFSGIANAIDAKIDTVQVDGTDVNSRDTIRLDVTKGGEVEVKVTVKTGAEALKDVQIEAFIRGYDHDDLIEDITDVFDLDANARKTQYLKLKIPERIDNKDKKYTMVILASSRNGVFDSLTWNVDLLVSSERHLIEIKDVVLSPEREVQAGRALLTTVRVKNYGQKEEDGIKVKVSIPELGVSASDFIEDLESDKSTSSEELYMRIPDCAKAGTYRVNVDVEYDDGDEVIRDYRTINVVGSDTCAPIATPVVSTTTPKTIITVGADAQDVVQGQGGVVYPITITNAGNAARTYTVTVDGGANWANFRVSPTSTVLLQPEEATSVFVYVSARTDAPVGQQMFAVTVSSAGEILKQVPLRANVLAGQGSGVGVVGIKKGLEIGLIVLVVLLVILGLIIGFNKLRSEPEDESKTYY